MARLRTLEYKKEIIFGSERMGDFSLCSDGEN